MICPFAFSSSHLIGQHRLQALWTILGRWDGDLARHGERTADIAKRLGDALGTTEQFRRLLVWGARLHDIGKVVLPRAILDKDGLLTEEERRIIRMHPAYSFAILQRARLDAEFLQVVLFHHERFDGTGYPVGLKGEDIPLASRILTVADVYSALTSDRPYRHAYPPDQAFAIMKAVHSAFDPRVMVLLENVMQEEA